MRYLAIASILGLLLTGCSESNDASAREHCLYALIKAYTPDWTPDDTYALPECKDLSSADRDILRTDWDNFLKNQKG